MTALAGMTSTDAPMPQLLAALDTKRMAIEFDRRMFGSSFIGTIKGSRHRVEKCEVARVKHGPTRGWSVGYRLTVRDGRTGEQQVQLMNGQFYSNGSRDEYDEARGRAPIAPRFGPPVIHFEPLDMVVWAFPNDHALPELAALTDTDRLESDFLPGIALSRWGPHWRIDTLAHAVVSYVPGRRCCVRIDSTLRHRTTGKTRHWPVFAKVYSNEVGCEVDRVSRQLWDLQLRDRSCLGVARPLGYWPDRRILWQEGVTGQPMDYQPGQAVHAAAFGVAGEAIAALHRASIDCTQQTTVLNVLARLKDRGVVIGRAKPDRQADIASVMEQLRAAEKQLNHSIYAPIHGDLHAANLFIDGGMIFMIDLDQVSAGPPLFDIGCFLARILYRAHRRGKQYASVQPWIEEFLRRYRENVSWPVPASEVAWYVAAALITDKAFRYSLAADPKRQKCLPELIELAGLVLHDGAALLGESTDAGG